MSDVAAGVDSVTDEEPRPHRHHDLLRGGEPLGASGARRRDLKHRLTDAVRRVVDSAQMVDAEECSEADLAALVEATEEVADRIDAVPSIRRFGTISGAPGWQAALMERSPISGRGNPAAAPLFLAPDGPAGQLLRGHATYGYAYEGPHHSVHGGVVAGAFDELVGVAQALSGRSGMTGTLTVRMRRPTPLHSRIEYEAGVDRVEGRKIFVWGRSTSQGELLAEADAVMITPRDAPSRR